MEELNEYERNLKDFLEELEFLIKKIEDLYFTIEDCEKKSKSLNIKLEYICENKNIADEVKDLRNDFINNSNIDEIKLNKINEELKNTNIICKIEEEINNIKSFLYEEIYKKVIKAIYVSKWREKEKEILYLDYKDTIISRIIGEAKFRRLSIEKKKLENECIKKEYYKEVKKYKGQTIEEIIGNLINNGECDFEVIELKTKLINIFKMDKKVLRYYIPKAEWKVANIIPYGIIEKIKYYKRLNKETINEIEKIKIILQENVEMEYDKQTTNKVFDLTTINEEIKELIMKIKNEK